MIIFTRSKKDRILNLRRVITLILTECEDLTAEYLLEVVKI